MKFIRTASEKYINVIFKNLDQSLKSLILTKFNEIKGENEKHTKSLRGDFIKSLRKLKDINEESINLEFNKIGDFEDKEIKLHPKVKELPLKRWEKFWVNGIIQEQLKLRDIPDDELAIDLSIIKDAIIDLNNLIKENKSDKRLTDFSNKGDLFEYLKQFKQETDFEAPEVLQKLLNEWKLDEINNEGYNIKLYKIKRAKDLEGEYILFNGLDSIQYIGQNTGWCVSWDKRPHKYTPDEYHCFFIDNEPKILVHKDSSQIKDENDIELNNFFVKVINPLVEKFNLNTGEGDFFYYNDTLKMCNDIKENIDNRDYIEGLLNEDISYICYLPLENVVPYLNTLYLHLSKFVFRRSPKELLEYLGRYVNLNNLDREYIDGWVFDILESEPKQYLKKVPNSFKTQRFNKLFELSRSNNFKDISGKESLSEENIELFKEVIRKDGYVTSWAEDWLKDNLRLFVGEMKYFMANNDFNPPDWAYNFAYENPELFIDEIREYLRIDGRPPDWAYNFVKENINLFTDIIKDHIIKENFEYGPYSWAEDFIGEIAPLLIDEISLYISNNDFNPPEWVWDFVKKNANLFIDEIKKCMRLDGDIPDWSLDFVEKNTNLFIDEAKEHIRLNGDVPDWAYDFIVKNFRLFINEIKKYMPDSFLRWRQDFLLAERELEEDQLLNNVVVNEDVLNEETEVRSNNCNWYKTYKIAKRNRK